MIEIFVYDEVKVFEGIEEAVAWIKEVVQKWLLSDDTEPLTIKLTKNSGRAPPLQVYVSDSVRTKEALG
jgi:hypothetical protein